ncbi:MAG: PLP-dependent transferase [Verrucomicrobiales bacterium]|nr:PLP-dependent transferase [Verrucomicrobiales bacterium]
MISHDTIPAEPPVDLVHHPRWQEEDLGLPLPDSPHAVSVAMPLWEHVVAYEENDPRVTSRFQSGYPRFFLQPVVRRLFSDAGLRSARDGEQAVVFPSGEAAARCSEYVERKGRVRPRLIPFGWGDLTSVLVPTAGGAFDSAMKYWRYCGEIVSSRVAEQALLGAAPDPAIRQAGERARREIRQHLADYASQSAAEVFLYPSGMAAIAVLHRALVRLNPGLPTAQVEFPYVDLLKVQEEFGSGVHPFLLAPGGGPPEIAPLLYQGGLAGVYTEAPSNPLMRTADLPGLASMLAPRGIPLVVDDTVASSVNVDVLRYADVAVSSLTKWFSGQGDVLAGAVILRSNSPLAADLGRALRAEGGEDLSDWDAIALEKTSRNYESRVLQVNRTAAALHDLLSGHPGVERIWHPLTETPHHFEAVWRGRPAGHGGLLSLLLKDSDRTSPSFYRHLRLCKGPSFGTAFSMACPFTLLAHYQELEAVARSGVPANLIRVSVGLEDEEDLLQRFQRALESR